MRKTLVISLLLLLLFSPGLKGQEKDGILQGKDKVELEQMFWDELFASSSPLSRVVPDNLQRIKSRLYVSENGWYETEAAQNTAFFHRTQSAWMPVCESDMPLESAMTLLTGYSIFRNYTVRLEQHRYGNETVQDDVPLNQLLAYCLETGCKPYVGIESSEGDIIIASLFMVNHQLGYCHTFKFEIEKHLLDEDTGIITASAYTFTPIYNLSK